MTARLYHLFDNVTRHELGIVSRYNAKAVMCYEYDTSQEGVIEAIEDIEDHMAHVSRDPEWGCDLLNCRYTEATIDEVLDLAMIDVLFGAHIRKSDMLGHPLELVGFSAKATRALQAVYCGWDLDCGCGVHRHYIEAHGLNDEEAQVLNTLRDNELATA